MIKPLYFRKGSEIRGVTGHQQNYKTISAAKRASRELQKAAGGEGRGFLRVVKTWPSHVADKQHQS